MGPLPFTILQKVKKFYKPDHPTKKSFEFEPPHRQSTNATVPYGPYSSYTNPTTHTLPHLGYTLDQYATHPWLYACH